ncbi:MAG: FtsQ-type POTRA domain-containing protein [bacterium]
MTKSKISVESNFLSNPRGNNKSIKNTIKSKAPIFSSLTIIIIFVGLIAASYFTGLFNIKNYKIIGNSQVAKIDIENAISSETDNKLILTVNPDSIEKGLRDKFKILYFARVTKELPSTLVIEVKERTKAAVIRTLENIVLVSQDGVVIQELLENQIVNEMYQNIPVVKMIDDPKRNIGYQYDADYIKSISTFVNSWNELKAPAYNSILIDKEKNVKIALSSNTIITVSLNDPNIDYKNLVSDLTGVYNRLSTNQKIKSIDMRFDKIAVTYF